MPIQKQAGIRPLETSYDFEETRVGAVGFIFHGRPPETKRRVPVASNQLHFARCARLDRINEDDETKFWFRSVRVAHKYLNETYGEEKWRWCKYCQREITQRILDER